ncbi:hypothetical protein ARMGADRAFT_1040588 [Armillaria gallica]|uniref:Uncharacterized protein n=1 Tax=Armillaria gallica TaxID=47427 RepID=A0A2H3C9H4_ARMGA|nr:hypothetical protein ARMGADRAFT_1040588 [Armillaria gallica]
MSRAATRTPWMHITLGESQCVVSGKYDQTTLSEVSAPTDEIWEAGVVYTQCAHMAPESTNLDEDSSNKECWRFLKSFGYTIERLNGTDMVRITRKPPHPKQSHLHPGPLRNPIHLPLPPEITFTTPDNENLPVPSETARYLCQGRPVFWGIDKQDRVVEDLGALAEDGNLAEVSSSA